MVTKKAAGGRSTRVTRTPRVVILFAAFAGCIPGQQECAPCHPKEVELHLQTHHARAARPIQQSGFFRQLPDRPIAEARGGFLLSYAIEGDAVRVVAERGSERASALVEWVFGAGDQGETPILKSGNSFIEHRISFYNKSGKFDLTLGHQPGPSASARAALGIPQKAQAARACFACHTTAPGDGEALRPGIECGRCHAGAAEHARGIGKAINPAKVDALNAVELCAECHRLEAPGAADDPLNIRFQPLRLVKSRCFLAGGMTCATCHEAHRNARRLDSAYYISKCVACHDAPHRGDDCLPCHMPTSSPAPYLTFTDHYIRKLVPRK